MQAPKTAPIEKTEATCSHIGPSNLAHNWANSGTGASIPKKIGFISGHKLSKNYIRILILYIFCLHYFEFPALLTVHNRRENAREIQNSVQYQNYNLIFALEK